MGKIPNDWITAHITPIHKKEYRQLLELLANQSDIACCQGYGTTDCHVFLLTKNIYYCQYSMDLEQNILV